MQNKTLIFLTKAALIVMVVGIFISCDPISLKTTIDNLVLGWTRAVVLVSPTDEEERPEKTPLLDWEDAGSATGYELQIAEAEDQLEGSDVITVTASEYEYPENLTISDQKFWRVRAVKEGETDTGVWSEAWSFEIVPSTDPQVIGSLDVGGGGYRVVLKDNYAYLARQVNGVSIVDISDLTSPTLVGSITGIETSHDLAVSGDYLYCLDVTEALNPKQFKVYDITNRTSPTEAASIDLTYGGDTYKAGSHSFGFWGTSLFAPLRRDTGSGAEKVIGEFNIADPENPSVEDVIDITDDGFDVAITGNLLLFSQSSGPSPAEHGVGAYNLIGSLSNFFNVPNMDSGFIELYKNYACVSDLNGPVRFIDISDPTSLTQVSTFDTDSGGGTSVGGIVGKYLYVGDYSTGEAYFVDISDITDPTLYSTIGEGLNIFLIEGNYGYGLDYTAPGTFYVIDLIPGD